MTVCFYCFALYVFSFCLFFPKLSQAWKFFITTVKIFCHRLEKSCCYLLFSLFCLSNSLRIRGYFITYPRLREFFALLSRFIGCMLSFFLIWIGINSFVPICLAKLLTRASTISRKNRKNAFLSENCKVSLHFLPKTSRKSHFSKKNKRVRP